MIINNNFYNSTNKWDNEMKNKNKIEKIWDKQNEKIIDLTKIENNVEISYARLKKVAEHIDVDWSDIFIERDISFLKKCIQLYWENFMHNINTDTINDLEWKIESQQKEIDIVEAKNSFEKIEKDIELEFLWLFDLHMRKLNSFVDQYGDDFIEWINSKKLQDLQKAMDFIKAPKMFKELDDDIKKWKWFASQENIKYLKKFIDNYGENTIAWLNYDYINKQHLDSIKILGVKQKWIIKFANDKFTFITPENWDKDLKVDNSKIEINEWDKIEYIIEDTQDGINIIIEDKITE